MRRNLGLIFPVLFVLVAAALGTALWLESTEPTSSSYRKRETQDPGIVGEVVELVAAETRPELEVMSAEELASLEVALGEARRIQYESRKHEPVWGGYGVTVLQHFWGTTYGTYQPPFRVPPPSAPGVIHPWGEELVVVSDGRVRSLAIQPSLELRSDIDLDLYLPRRHDHALILVEDDLIVAIASGSSRAVIVRRGEDGALSYAGTIELPHQLLSAHARPIRLVDGHLLYYTAFAETEGYDTRSEGDFASSRTYRPVQPDLELRLHAAVSCALDTETPRCVRHRVFAPEESLVYASASAVYLWVPSGPIARQTGSDARAVLYRVPWNINEPARAVRVAGAPTATDAVREAPGGGLDALVLHVGETPWSTTSTTGDVALLRVLPTAWESLESDAGVRYIQLPRPTAVPFCATFVGEYLLYGGECGASRAGAAGRQLVVHRARGGEHATLQLPHSFDRLVAMGDDALALGVGPNGLNLTAIHLSGGPTVAGSHSEPFDRPGELRAWGIAFIQQSDTEGLLGIPHVYARVEDAHVPGSYPPPSVRLLSVTLGEVVGFRSMGRLDVADRTPGSLIEPIEDRVGRTFGPVFVGDRIYARLGRHVVSGQLEDGAVVAAGSVNVGASAED